jgi:voltage-gated potassium channel Kch
VTTVGYGDIVTRTVTGKILAIGIILTGVGSAMVVLQSTFEMRLSHVMMWVSG